MPRPKKIPGSRIGDRVILPYASDIVDANGAVSAIVSDRLRDMLSGVNYSVKDVIDRGASRIDLSIKMEITVTGYEAEEE